MSGIRLEAKAPREVAYRVWQLKHGVPAEELLWHANDAPTVMWDKDGEIKATMSASFYRTPGLDLLKGEIQPVLLLDGVEHPLGVFQAATVQEQHTAYGETVRVEAYDRCWRMKSNRTERVLHFAMGTAYTTAIEQMLTECGIGLRLVEKSKAVFATDREDWEIGTDYLTIINALLDEISYDPIWFDANGVARVQRYRDPATRSIAHFYGDAGAPQVQNAVLADSGTETDLFSTPNVFICVCSNPELGGAMVAVAENNNAASKTSIFQRGMRIAAQYQVNSIASQEELQEYAERKRMESLFSTERLSFETPVEGGHGIGDTISINARRLNGIYEETAWSITMKAGDPMKHTARRELSTV